MTIDTKLTVLYALYAEWQKDIPKMRDITAASLKLDETAFNVALFKLQEEGYIKGANFYYANQSPYPIYVLMDGISVTRDGVERVEQNLDLKEQQTNKEKLQTFLDKAKRYGWDMLASVVAKIIAEIVTK